MGTQPGNAQGIAAGDYDGHRVRFYLRWRVQSSRGRNSRGESSGGPGGPFGAALVKVYQGSRRARGSADGVGDLHFSFAWIDALCP
jgi:hypothetical protein